ncbi:hypothetical protein D7223_23430 [Micromonospora endolithica]|uniref:Uncharacterized protein n=1 Tax=Micromonospora endolithica TaxID=230091 RepID=A0A3A9Z1C8_9ACTN|nr:hypothetical protein [Micromonospora endolithica]RKN42093.1 hypothetical protein D7223_23430 [Micromonospora endolithica]
MVEAAQGLPALPGEEKRDQQVKIRLTASEVEKLVGLRPDLTAAGIVALLVDDVLSGRTVPEWTVGSCDGSNAE